MNDQYIKGTVRENSGHSLQFVILLGAPFMVVCGAPCGGGCCLSWWGMERPLWWICLKFLPHIWIFKHCLTPKKVKIHPTPFLFKSKCLKQNMSYSLAEQPFEEKEINLNGYFLKHYLLQDISWRVAAPVIHHDDEKVEEKGSDDDQRQHPGQTASQVKGVFLFIEWSNSWINQIVPLFYFHSWKKEIIVIWPLLPPVTRVGTMKTRLEMRCRAIIVIVARKTCLLFLW